MGGRDEMQSHGPASSRHDACRVDELLGKIELIAQDQCAESLWEQFDTVALGQVCARVPAAFRRSANLSGGLTLLGCARGE